MAGALVHIGTEVAGGSDATLKITGITSDYDVYLLVAKGIKPATDDDIAWRVTKGGTIQDDSAYDNARKDQPSNANMQDNEGDGANAVTNANIESTQHGYFGNFYLFNFADTSQYSAGTFETVGFVSTPQGFGGNGSFIHYVASASDGISFHFVGGANIAAGRLELYGIKN
tara:strand:- start:33734 stop:34246 length:513 start_codon:yes stop_codon:yes gene_type:complete